MAQADACDREKARPSLIQQTMQTMETSPDGRMLESNPLYETIQNDKKKAGI